MPLTDDPWLPAPDGSGNIPAVRDAAPVAVYRYDGVSTLTLLPNVECLWIEHREGTDPGSARFRYNLASGVSGAPTSIETALGSGSGGAATVNPGDRLVVQGTHPDGETVECLFDGFAVDFGMGLDSNAEQVYLTALGVAWRCWDTTIPGAIMRDASAPTTVSDVLTRLPAVFNPDGRPNCIPDGAMAGTNAGGVDNRYPTFLDPLVVRSPDVRTQWTLPKAARYLLYTNNLAQPFVLNPDGSALDALLVAPNPGGSPLTLPIACPDLPITGKDWPGTLCRLAREAGFGMRFRLSTAGGLPQTALDLYAPQAMPTQSLYLGIRGSAFSPTTFNVGSAAIHRDVHDTINNWRVIGAPDRWEASFILCDGFGGVPSDFAGATSLHNFDVDNVANRDKYRLYVFDETGEGHYPPYPAVQSQAPTSLDAILGAGLYARRRRPPIGQLLTRDLTTGVRLRARLDISLDYAGSRPGAWDGSGTWQEVTASTWELLPDRVGIRITDHNPNTWRIGALTASGVPFPSGVVHGVEIQCGASGVTPFKLKLTCVIEGDQAVADTIAAGSSPLPWVTTRTVDASDRYRRDRVYYPSTFNWPTSGSAPGGYPQPGATIIARDDTTLANAECAALQASTASGVLEGPVTIPRLTTYYAVGDRIDQIEGRDLGLRTDDGSGSPVYPTVVAVRWEFDGEGGQATTLELSDGGTDRNRYRRSNRRRGRGRR